MYAGERQLTIPYETPAGEYALFTVVYDFEQRNSPLPVRNSDGAPAVGYFTTIVVEQSAG